MLALSGFFTVSFFPMSVMALLGLLCVWCYRHDKIKYELLYIAILFLAMLLWRIPVVKSSRYMLPMIIPGVVLSVLLVEFLSKRFLTCGRLICLLLLLSTAVIGIGKTLRTQEKKPYLTNIPEIILHDMHQNDWGHALVMVLGNVGGIFDFEDNITLKPVSVSGQYGDNDYNEIQITAAKCLENEYLLAQYPVCYMIISSMEPPEDFIKRWEAHWGQKLTLCYEFIRPQNHRRFQLFRLVSAYPSGHLTPKKRFEIYQKFNLLPNPDFSKVIESSEFTPFLQLLATRGIIHDRVPVDWELHESWSKVTSAAGLEFSGRQTWHIFSDRMVMLEQRAKPFPPGKKYQLGGRITGAAYSHIFALVAQVKNNRIVSSTYLFSTEVLQQGSYEFSAQVDLTNIQNECIISFGLYKGSIELENLYLVEESVFENVDLPATQ